METIDRLGLLLWYFKSSDRHYKLAPVFSLVPTSLSAWINYAVEVRIKIIDLNLNSDVRVQWPAPAELVKSIRLLKNNRPNVPILSNIFRVLDGSRIPYADYVNADVQNPYYDGYKTSVVDTNLLCYNFKGKLIHAGLNFPGSCHDSRVVHSSGLIGSILKDNSSTSRGLLYYIILRSLPEGMSKRR